MDNAARQLKLTLSDTQENLIDTLEKIFSYNEVHQKLVKKTEIFFQTAASTEEENSTIFLIKDYIGQKYMNETLSVKDISDHVFLSTSYVCTFFKNETGQTLNQYLTEYRMEKPSSCCLTPGIKLRIFPREWDTVTEIISVKVLRSIQVFLLLNIERRWVSFMRPHKKNFLCIPKYLHSFKECEIICISLSMVPGSEPAVQVYPGTPFDCVNSWDCHYLLFLWKSLRHGSFLYDPPGNRTGLLKRRRW